ncbi:LacI family DNA-binding transcriptional regulator [Mucilaginibacter sp. JRF]|uniref:LacI family DNA-binding transcriptional regulator n=1 Tax=Mucilaginibacter sp. JRF TaxID=2780088 RepID=UPI0018823C8E|nr:LacI family DNA-binding transcriptional regulator [Mucilaginibacter sp. JRF]MBE9583207.1 LacI family DNA-binding transcriptional regulator [Mucilaginibacter sp. JRF]
MKKVLLKDIARHVGVSTALVSYVLNGQAEEKQVSKENAARILAAAEELNYRPNQIAKSLKTQKTHTIGLIVADINYRFSSGITSAIEAEAKKKNFTVIFGCSNESAEKFDELVTVLVNRQVDGLIMVPTENSEPAIHRLQRSEIPFVLVDRNFPNLLANSILIDNYKAAYDSTSYLIKQGHTRIAFINYQTTMFHLNERKRGYIDALSDNGIEPVEQLIKLIKSTSFKPDVDKAINYLVGHEHKCDAIFFATDRLAITGLQEINRQKVKVPEDVSVFSFDEAEAFDLFYCPISHARQPLEKMGKLAVNALLDLIHKNKIINQIYLESDFVYGKSCRE